MPLSGGLGIFTPELGWPGPGSVGLGSQSLWKEKPPARGHAAAVSAPPGAPVSRR